MRRLNAIRLAGIKIMRRISETQWQSYERDGYLKLGKLLPDDQLRALQRRIDEIMLGQAAVDYDCLLMQLDSTTGRYEDLGEQTTGFKRATLEYRKIQGLEHDSLFLAYLEHPVFRDICARVYGPQSPISCYRAMFMNKPAGKGTLLPWHQDRWKSLDRDPLVTIWTALDPATRSNGCVQVIPRSHRRLINPEHHSAFLEPHHVLTHCHEDEIVYVELQAGEVVLLHNWLLHRSDVNATSEPRRAFSACYMDGRTIDHGGKSYCAIFR